MAFRPCILSSFVGPTSALAGLLCLTACPGGQSAEAEGDGSEGSADTSGEGEGESESGTETGGEELELVEIPEATYAMGCDASEVPCDSDNEAHDVTVSTFWIEATEVTAGDYAACVEGGGCTPAGEDPGCNYNVAANADHPINCVTWQQAVDYCAWAGRRLPTEAEWELAAGGSSPRPYPWGTAAADCTLAHMFSGAMDMGDYGCMTGTTAPVGSYPNGASPYGLLDMAGNVEEWVADWYANDYYAESPAVDPPGPDSGTQRGARGGSLLDASSLNLRVFRRSRANPDIAANQRGFRCAADGP